MCPQPYKLSKWRISAQRCLSKGKLSAMQVVTSMFKPNWIQLNKGADSARGDDASSLKKTVALWLNESRPTPNPPISSVDKSGRGFYHDATGELLCPVDFHWANPRYDLTNRLTTPHTDYSYRTKEGIRNYEPDFQVTAHSWPAFLYSNGKYDPDDPTKGLFKSAWLVRVGISICFQGIVLTYWHRLSNIFLHPPALLGRYDLTKKNPWATRNHRTSGLGPQVNGAPGPTLRQY